MRAVVIALAALALATGARADVVTYHRLGGRRKQRLDDTPAWVGYDP